MKINTFEVINGYIPKLDCLARSGGFDEKMKDGWYWIADDGDTDGHGPFPNEYTAEKAGHLQHNSKVVLGHTFHLMCKLDWDGYAGADEGTMICHLESGDMLLDPEGTIWFHKDEEQTVEVWKITETLP